MFGASDTKEICGHSFRIAKNGLDETDVSTIIKDLVRQNEELSDKLENLESLTRFAGKMVDEAESVAEGIKTDAVAEASTRAASILAEGERAAGAARERITAEANEDARYEAARLQEEADLLTATSHQAIERDLRERFETACSDLLSVSEGEPLPAPPKAECGEDSAPAIAEAAFEGAYPELESYLPAEQQDNTECDYVYEAIVEDAPDMEDPYSPVLQEAELVAASIPDVGAAVQWPDAEPADQPPAPGDPLYEGTVELRIPPPVSLHGLMALHKQLKENPDIQVGDVTGSAEEGASVELHLPTRVPLLHFLASLQGVERVFQVRDLDGESGADDRLERSLASTIQLTVS